MRVRVVVINGRQWARTADVCAQLRIDRKRLNQWVARGHVDRPRRVGSEWFYDLDQATEAEYQSEYQGRICDTPTAAETAIA